MTYSMQGVLGGLTSIPSSRKAMATETGRVAHPHEDLQATT